MTESQSERRMTENEVIFREFNEGIQQGFDELNQAAAEQGEQPYVLAEEIPLHFYCECADEKCAKRIAVLPHVYNDIHKDRNSFIILPDHQVPAIEVVIEKNADYWVVQKYEVPPRTIEVLNKTDLHNT